MKAVAIQSRVVRKRPLGWPDLHGLTAGKTNSLKNAKNTKNTRKNAAEYTNTNKIQEPFPLPVGPTGPIESQRERLARYTRRDLGWLFLQRPTEPFQ